MCNNKGGKSIKLML